MRLVLELNESEVITSDNKKFIISLGTDNKNYNESFFNLGVMLIKAFPDKNIEDLKDINNPMLKSNIKSILNNFLDEKCLDMTMDTGDYIYIVHSEHLFTNINNILDIGIYIIDYLKEYHCVDINVVILGDKYER